MNFTDTLLAAGQYFLVIALELTALFIVVCLIVGALNVYVPKEKMQKVLWYSGSVRGSVIGAAFGAITPFCSCSTIPVTLGFLNSGVAFSSAMSFLFASPLLNPVIIAMMLVIFGPEITVVYAILMFTAAVLISLTLERLGFKKYVKPVAVEGMTEETGTKLQRILRFAWTTFRQMIPYLLLGAAIIGIPLYIRAETILPISAALLSKGMGVGTVAALLIGGAGMSIPDITMLSAIFKKQFVLVFVATIFIAALVTGLVVQVIV